jgi:hypothetical protein
LAAKILIDHLQLNVLLKNLVNLEIRQTKDILYVAAAAY